MKRNPSSKGRRSSTKSVLRYPHLEHAKAAVLNSLNSADAKRGYCHAIDEFVDWYCSEPRLAFNRIVVLRYRSHLESRQLAPGTINLRLGAVRRLAYEAFRLRSSQQRFSCRCSSRQRCEETGHSSRKPVNDGARPCAVASPRSSTTERKTRPSLARIATGVSGTAGLFAEPELLVAYRESLARQDKGPHLSIGVLADYIAAEQGLGRIDSGVDAKLAAYLLMSSSFFCAFMEKFSGKTMQPSWEQFAKPLVAAMAPQPERNATS
jgi:hypothetical protein